MSALALVAGFAVSAPAQTLAAPAPPAAPGLFARPAARDSHLVVTASTLGAWDDNLMATDTATVPDPRTQQRGAYALGMSRLSYTNTFEHFDVGASGTSTLRYFPTLNNLVGAQHGVSANGAFHFGKTRIEGSQTFEYVPLFSFMNVPRLFDMPVAEPQPIVFDQIAQKRQGRQVQSSAQLTQTFGRNTSGSLWFSRDMSDYTFAAAGGLTTQTFGGRVAHHLTRHISGLLGLSQQEARYRLAAGGTQLTAVKSIDAGLDYDRAIGRRRRTLVGFTSGLTTIKDGAGDNPYRLLADARLSRLIGRSWNVTGAYHRGVGFVAGFEGPFFADSVAVNASGTLSRRLELTFAGAYSRGQVGLVATNNQTESFSGSSRMRLGLSRHTAISAEYLLYHYLFDPGVTAIGIPPSLNRQGARFGFDIWFPIFR